MDDLATRVVALAEAHLNAVALADRWRVQGVAARAEELATGVDVTGTRCLWPPPGCMSSDAPPRLPSQPLVLRQGRRQ
ncbi:hypothetical protein AB0M46_23560 [Dactylosporangium sp. NPDC051485]|uniref:hypothetical protein n=1 Tax=Dactylosporangium sp. NPDC051485 TaxID=3154846 RepID=UPI0034468875